MSSRAQLERFLALKVDADPLVRWADGDPAPAGFDRLRTLVLEHTRIDPGLALEAARRLRLVVRGQPAGLRAQALRLEAHARRSVGQARRAEGLYRRAWDLFTADRDRTEAARTAIGWMDALALVGRPRDAIDVARRARRVAGRDRLLRAKLDANLGNVWFTLRRHPEAARCYRDARAVFARDGTGWETAVCDFNLGKIALREGDPARALRHLEAASAVYADLGWEAARLEAEVARISATLLRDGLADARDQLSALHADLLRCGDERAAADALRELAEVLRGQGAPRLAVELAAEGFRAYERLDLSAERAELAHLHGRILADLGHDHDAALQHRRAADHWESTGNAWAARRARVETALAQLGRDDAAGALQTLRGVATYLDRRRHRSGARARWAMARAHLALGRPGRAASLARDAWDAATRFPEVADRPDMALTLARAHLARGEGGTAVRWARRALREFDRRAPLAGAGEVRSGVRAVRARLYREAIRVVLESGVRRAENVALDLVLRARSAALADDLLQREGSRLSTRLRRRIAELRREMQRGPDGGDDVRFQRIRVELERAEARLPRDARPRPAPVRALGEEPSLAAWRKHRPHRDLVVFHSEGRTWQAFVARRGGRVEVVPLPDASRVLEREWVDLRMMMEAAATVPQARRTAFLERTTDEALAILEALRDAWIRPLRLEGDADFVPTGILHGIPLEALAARSGSGPSLVRIPHPGLVRGPGRRKRGPALFLRGDTPGVPREARAVRGALRRGGVRLSSRGRPDLGSRPWAAVHVAAHGVFHPREWLLSGFRLEDGWLGREHFTPGALRGSLVFLGSCESGMGRMGPGAELGHWIGAAVTAGVRELVVTLWKVDDETSVAFAEPFYEAWSAGADATAAAAHARARVRARHPHPFCWAPYLALGR